MRIKIDNLIVDAGTQPREKISQDIVDEYAELMKTGTIFPSVVVFREGKNNWLADGYHRLLAAKQNEQTAIDAEIKEGGLRDAILFAMGANSTHGLRRTNKDKHRTVMMLLNDEEWSKWSDNEIAKRCCVSQNFVSEIHRSLKSDLSEDSESDESDECTYTTKHGTPATMKTSNIGKSKPKSKVMSQEEYENESEAVEYNNEDEQEALEPDEQEEVSGNVAEQEKEDDPRKLHLGLHLENAKAMASTLVEFFDRDYLEEVMEEILKCFDEEEGETKKRRTRDAR